MVASREDREFLRRRVREILQHRTNPNTTDSNGIPLTFRDIFKLIYGEAAISRMSYDRLRDLENALARAISWHREQGCRYIIDQLKAQGKFLRDRGTTENPEPPVNVAAPSFLPYAKKIKIKGRKGIHYAYYNAIEERTREGLITLFDEKIDGLSFRRRLLEAIRLNNSPKARREWERRKAQIEEEEEEE